MDNDSVKLIREQEYYAELGRAAEKGLLEVRSTISCRGVYKTFECDLVAATKNCSMKYFCQRWKGAVGVEKVSP